MIKVENIGTWGFEHAIRGMRNPLNSWDKSNSGLHYDIDTEKVSFVICENDLELMQKLFKASLTGNYAHRKYLRQIFVSMDITAPLYWWKEFDTYKVGTVSNSCSTMHTIHKKEFEMKDFSNEYILDYFGYEDKARFRTCFIKTIKSLNVARQLYLSTGDKKYWYAMIQMLPSSYNQRRTVTMNYENVFNIILQRTGHKLDEWNDFVEILKELPYVREIMEDGEK